MSDTGPPARPAKVLRIPAAFCCALLTLLITGSGCAVDEKQEVDLYRSVLDGPKPPRIEYHPGEPLSLPTALILANQNNERLAIQGEDYVQALVDRERAASAFFPTISILPSFSKADKGGDGGRTAPASSGNPSDTAAERSAAAFGRDTTDVPLNVNMNVFRGFRDVANTARSEAEIRRNRSLLLDLQQAVLLDVARAYYQVLQAERSAQVLENSVALQNQRVREMRMRDAVGSASKLDVAQIEAQAAAARASLIAARVNVRVARALLAFLVDAPVADAPLIDKLDPPAENPTIESFIALAEARRHDIQAAREAIESARQNVQSAFGQYYPSVSVNINYYLSRQTTPTDSDWNSLIQANLPLFTGGRIRADTRTALSQLRQAKSNESLLRRQIINDVFAAYENFSASARRIEELVYEVEAAQQALNVATANYEHGRGTYLDQLTAQDRLLSAQLELAEERFNRKLQYLNLLRLSGALTRPPTPESLSTEALFPTTGPIAPPAEPAPRVPDTVPTSQP